MNRDIVYLQTIIDNAKKIVRFIGDQSYEEFVEDDKTQYAVAKALEEIGEHVKKFSLEFTDRYFYIEWKKIARLRDKLSHHYGDIDPEQVWTITKDSIPDLIHQLESIQQQL